jgi:hypothetical protein
MILSTCGGVGTTERSFERRVRVIDWNLESDLYSNRLEPPIHLWVNVLGVVIEHTHASVELEVEFLSLTLREFAYAIDFEEVVTLCNTALHKDLLRAGQLLIDNCRGPCFRGVKDLECFVVRDTEIDMLLAGVGDKP